MKKFISLWFILMVSMTTCFAGRVQLYDGSTINFQEQYNQMQDYVSYKMKVKLKMTGPKSMDWVKRNINVGHGSGYQYNLGEDLSLILYNSENGESECFCLTFIGPTKTEKDLKLTGSAFIILLNMCGLDESESNKIINDTYDLSTFFTGNGHNYKIWCSNKRRYINIKSYKKWDTKDDRYIVEIYATND